jgi:MFS family permease
VTGSYGALLRLSRVPAVLGSVLVGRLPTAMMTVAIVLGVAGDGGSYARAGFLSGAHAAGAALAQPAVGRLLDRRGRIPVLLPLGIGFAVSCGLLVALLDRRLVIVAWPAVLSGCTLPPLSAAGRAALLELVPPAVQQQGLVLDTTLMELVFVVGPPFAAGLAATAHPSAGLAGTGAVGAGGTIAFLGAARGRPRPSAAPGVVPGVGPQARPTRATRVLLARFVVTAALFDTAFASANLAVLAAARGSAVPGAVLLALWAGGSMTGGLLFGLAPRRRIPLRGLVFAVSAHMAVLVLVPRPELMPPVLFVGGLVIAPTLAVLFERLAAAVPIGRRNEAYSWLTTGFLVGGGAGAAIGGYLVGPFGFHATIAVSAAAMVMAALVVPSR